MTSTLLIVQIALAIAITISVLLQKSSSIGLGAYSGSNESMFGAKGPMGFLTKATFTIAFLFVINTLVLGYLYTKENNRSVVDSVKSAVPVSAEKATTNTPEAPAAPVKTDIETKEEVVPTAPTSTVPEAPASVPAVTIEENITSQAKAPEVNEIVSSTTPQAPTEENATETTAIPATH